MYTRAVVEAKWLVEMNMARKNKSLGRLNSEILGKKLIEYCTIEL